MQAVKDAGLRTGDQLTEQEGDRIGVLMGAGIGGLPEIVQHQVNGWLVAPGNAARLSAALAEAIEHPESWRAFGAQGRRHYEATFSPERTEKAIGALAASIIARNITDSASSATLPQG